MMVSVIITTNRLGGIDVLAESMCNQTMPKEYFEIIFVDEWFPKREKFNDLYNLNLKFYPPDFKIPYYDPCNACNTALRLSKGELIVELTDNIWVYPEFLQDHWNVYKNNKNCTMVGYIDRYPFPQFKNSRNEEDLYYSIFKNEWNAELASVYFDNVVPEYQERYGGNQHLGPEINGYPEMPGSFFYFGLNHSLPRDLLVRLNGFDERYDGAYGCPDIDVGLRANALGHKFLLDKNSLNFKFGQQKTSINLPSIKKERIRPPESNYSFLLEKIKNVNEKREPISVPTGYGLDKHLSQEP